VSASEWRARLSLLVASSLVVPLVAELALRVVGFVPERFELAGSLENAARTLLLDCYPTNPRGYFDVDLRSPESRRRYAGLDQNDYANVARRAPYAVEVRYNAQGFRDRPFGPKPPGVLRVMVLGDSFTEGQGVKEPDTAVRVLGRLLNAARPGRFEVLNCGRRGSDFPELFETFQSILRFDPDLVVYAMVLNDPDRSEAFHARQKFLDDWIVARDRMQRRPPRLLLLDSRLAAFVSDRLTAYRVGRDTTRWYLEMCGPQNRAGWRRTERWMRAMNDAMRARGGALLVAIWPLLVDLDGQYPFEPVHETIARFCLEAGIPYHDLLPALRGRESASLWVHPVDRHPNEVAQRLAAESLLPAVLKLSAALPPEP
jgi:GDSL-like Lipase/Acylhydrolase family